MEFGDSLRAVEDRERWKSIVNVFCGALRQPWDGDEMKVFFKLRQNF